MFRDYRQGNLQGEGKRAGPGIPLRILRMRKSEVALDKPRWVMVSQVVGLGANEEGVISENSSLENWVSKGRYQIVS